MKPNKKLTFTLGIALFVVIILAFGLSKKINAPQDISFDKALAAIKNKEATEVTVRQADLELTTKTGERLVANLDGSDATCEVIIRATIESGATVKLESASSGWGWLLLINALPFFMMSAVTLAAIIYIVKTLTKTKVEK